MADSIDLVLASLVQPDVIKQNKIAAEQAMNDFSSDEIKYLRKRAKLDLYFLCTGVLGYNKFDKDFHGKLFGWMMRNVRSRFKCILLPRSFLKSTGLTIADSIRTALPNDPGTDFWPECLGLDCRILICHENHDTGAARFLFQITQQILTNKMLMGLFPEMIPNPRELRVNRYELDLAGRQGIYSEPTFDTMGVGGRTQGRHYNKLKLDDLIGDKARDSAVEMQRAKDWFDNVTSFFSELNDDSLDLIGTRWAFDDLYAHAFEQFGDLMLKYIIGAEKVEDGQIVPTCARLLGPQQISILKKNKEVWSANYANDPALNATGFDKSWKRYYTWHPNGRDLIYKISTDNYKIDYNDLDRVILIDPAMSGKTGFVVTGTDVKDRIFILEAVKGEWEPPQMVEHLFYSVLRWKPRIVVIESVNFSGLYMNWLPLEMQKRGIYFHIMPHKIGITQKEARVKQLANYFASGTIYFHPDQKDILQEYDYFGATSDYHLLDALAQGPSYWSKPFNKATFDRYRQIEEQMMSGIDPVTGYSSQ